MHDKVLVELVALTCSGDAEGQTSLKASTGPLHQTEMVAREGFMLEKFHKVSITVSTSYVQLTKQIAITANSLSVACLLTMMVSLT